jgi:GNAT superfamily N-acetyltransferase
VQVSELRGEGELREAFPVVHELRTHLDEATFMDRVRAMTSAGYRLLALRDGGRIVAVAGIEVAIDLHVGRHVWVHDLVTRADVRSRGYGAALLGHVEELARREGCDTVALNSGVQRRDAHRFYETRMGYLRTAYTFGKRVAV